MNNFGLSKAACDALEPLFVSLKPAEQLLLDVPVGDAMHRILVMLTDKTGFHTGRPRFLVVCTSCMSLLHDQTTGPLSVANFHAREIGRGE
jgi:hypothetical protein